MIGSILIVVVILVGLFVLLSPLESLDWWASRGERQVRDMLGHGLVARPDGPRPAAHYMVYLSGVGTLGGELSRREQAFLDALEERLPNSRVVGDIFPYSVENLALMQRTTAWIWGFLERMREVHFPRLLPMLINLRNIAQVLVSADPRYGPTFNVGLAREIAEALVRQGYRPGSGQPITLLGFSGGAQMAVGAAWFLDKLGIPVDVISLGGIFGDDPGLDRVRRLTHLTGEADRAHWLGVIAFPGRWPTAPLSYYGRAKRQGRIVRRSIGPITHGGERGYLARRAHVPDGRSHAEVTLDAVVQAIDDTPALPASG